MVFSAFAYPSPYMTHLAFKLTVRFKEFELTTSFDGEVRMLAVTGRSGIGKTSLLNALAGLLAPERGRISIDDDILFDHDSKINVPAYKRHIGYVFQDARLFPHMSIRHNLDYSAFLARHRTPVIERSRLIDLLGLARLLDRRPYSLSGGEQQRVAIARALISAPRLLLLDEPLSAIDKKRRDAISDMLLDVRRETSVPMILVSHNAEDIARLSDASLSLEAQEA